MESPTPPAPQSDAIPAGATSADLDRRSLQWRMQDGLLKAVVEGWAGFPVAAPLRAIPQPERPLLSWLRGLPEKGIPKTLVRMVVSDLEGARVGERTQPSSPNREQADRDRADAQQDCALWLLRKIASYRPEFRGLEYWDVGQLRKRLPLVAPLVDKAAPTLKFLGLSGEDFAKLTMAGMEDYPFRFDLQTKKLVLDLQQEMQLTGGIRGDAKTLPTQMCSLLTSSLHSNQPDRALLRPWLYHLVELAHRLPPVPPDSHVFRGARAHSHDLSRSGLGDAISPSEVAKVFNIGAVIGWRQVASATTEYSEAAYAMTACTRSVLQHSAVLCVMIPMPSRDGVTMLRDASASAHVALRKAGGTGRKSHFADLATREVIITPDARFLVADCVYDRNENTVLVVLRELPSAGLYLQVNPMLAAVAEAKEGCRELLVSSCGSLSWGGLLDSWALAVHDQVIVEEEQCWVLLDELHRRFAHHLLVSRWMLANATRAVAASFTVLEEGYMRDAILSAHDAACKLVTQLQQAVLAPRLTPARCAWLLSRLEEPASAQLAAACCGLVVLDPRKCQQLVLSPGYHLVLQGLGKWRGDAVTVFYLMLVVLQAAILVGRETPIVRQFSIFEATGICHEHPEDSSLALLYLRLWHDSGAAQGPGAASFSHAHLVALLESHADPPVLLATLTALRAVTRRRGLGRAIASAQPQMVSWVVRRALENADNRQILRRAVQIAADIAASNDCAAKSHCYSCGAGALALTVIGTCAAASDAGLLDDALRLLLRLAANREVAWRLSFVDDADAALSALLARRGEEGTALGSHSPWSALSGPLPQGTPQRALSPRAGKLTLAMAQRAQRLLRRV
eukprot:TRINITY_DN9486_c0_g1_i1.p1 TRINITY_DN9486_c0_g1~~TRINITY_DN9486_c0_g1_i1.p1  ORF type:complete len:852 (+),score=240.63 TRINITY_DN9486_c0_g1_i1:87-2642(+)